MVFGAASIEVQEVVHTAVESHRLIIAGKAIPVSSRRLSTVDQSHNDENTHLKKRQLSSTDPFGFVMGMDLTTCKQNTFISLPDL